MRYPGFKIHPTIILCGLLACGCEKRFDPFASSPLGLKVELKPVVEAAATGTEHPGKPEATLIRFAANGGSEATSSNQDSRTIKAISLMRATEGGAEEFSTFPLETLGLTAQHTPCPELSPDVAGLMSDFPGTILVCREDIIDALVRARQVTIQLSTGGIRYLTSWGVLRTEATGTRITIYSF